MANNEKIIADLIIKCSKGEKLTKEDSALMDQLCETPEEMLLALDLIKDQPWLDEDMQDPVSVPSKELRIKLKNYANQTKDLKPDSKAVNRLWNKWIGVLVIFVLTAAVFGPKLYKKTANNETFAGGTDGISGINNTDRTMLYSADGTMTAIDTMANGSQVQLSGSISMEKIDKHSWKLIGMEIGRMVKPFRLKVGIDVKFVNLLYPDESRVTLELHAIYSSSYRNSVHPDSIEGGKGRFDIAKNSQFPWPIHLPDGTFIRDLATCFEIDATISQVPRVSLVSGAVMVKASKGTVQLHPKEQAIIKNGEPIVSPLAVDTALWIWAKEPLVFDFKNTSLDQAVNRIARYYRVAVSNPNHVQGIHVTAKIPASKGLEFLCKRITEIQSTTAYLRMSADSIYITDRKP